MNDQFVKKVYKSSAIAWGIAMLWTLGLGKPWIALSITIGTAVSIAGLASFDKVVRTAFVPGATQSKKALIRLALVKYPILVAIIYLVVRWNKINLLAFCAGIVLVHISMLAKLAGISLVENLQTKKQASTNHEENQSWNMK